MTKFIVQPVEWNNYKCKWIKLWKKSVVSIDGTTGKMSVFAEAFFCAEKYGVTPFTREHAALMNKAFDKDREQKELIVIKPDGSKDYKGKINKDQRL